MTRLSPSPVKIYALLTLLAVLCTTAFLIYEKSQCRPDFITEKIQSVTQKRWEQLKIKTGEMLDHLKKMGVPDLVTYETEKLSEAGITILVQKDEKVIFWSDHNVPFEKVPEEYSERDKLIRLQNGWYLIYQIRYENYSITGLSLVRHNYLYDNEYLVSTFHPDYQVRVTPEIQEEPNNKYDISNASGAFLFSLDFKESMTLSSRAGSWAFMLFLISFIFTNLLLLHLHRKLNPFAAFPNLPLLAFAIDALILRFLIHYFSFPGIIHDTLFFNPDIYASSAVNRSLGDLFINGWVILIITWSFFRYWQSSPKLKGRVFHSVTLILLFISIPLLIRLYASGIRSIIFDSTLSFNFQNLLSVDLYSATGLLFIVIISVSLLLLLHRLYRIIDKETVSWQCFILSFIPACTLALVWAILKNDTISWMVWVTFLAFTAVYSTRKLWNPSRFNLVMLLLVVLSAGLTWLINSFGEMKEKDHRMMIAARYAQKDDPMAEYLFGEAREAMYRDTALAEMLFHDSINEGTVIRYILQKFFSGGEKHWARYSFQVTICNPDQKLVIESQNEVVDCFMFFRNQAMESGTMTMIPDLALIYDPIGQTSYLGALQFENVASTKPETIGIFIEIFRKMVPVDVGYLELLVDQSVKEESELNQYANARYHNGQLVASYGKYIYSIDLKMYAVDTLDHYFLSKGGYSHLFFKTARNRVLLISTPEKTLLDTLAPFSLFLLVFIIIYTVLHQGQQIFEQRNRLKTDFKYRLQGTLLVVIVVSFIVIGFTSIYYIIILNQGKNMDNLKDKARSIRIEVEHKLADKAILDQELKPYIQSLLIKFNDVFATDINLFDVDGSLLASSRQTIFNEGLISERMNTYAYREMAIQKKTLLIHEENIGKLRYLSAYIPFKNNQNKIIAYINLPYFARQSELSNEISSFLMAYINIYLLLIAITIIFTFLISDMIAKPLILIREKIQQVKLGAPNEKIAWQGQDEIGDLINEYNRMIDELERSADLLAKSERESAWREMAKQVAHEIKNPLTPIKLSLQHLEKTVKDDSPDWKTQFEKYALVMQQQIDSLSAIASAFSDFANMPKGKLQDIDLRDVIRQAILLFEGYQDVVFETRFDQASPLMVQGDQEMTNRMIINLITNAVQAKLPGKTLNITVEINKKEKGWQILVQDNGKGIDDEIRDRIFLPNFTTKSSGMGLGLAIARSIAESMGGTISFRSDPGFGTTFLVFLPSKC